MMFHAPNPNQSRREFATALGNWSLLTALLASCGKKEPVAQSRRAAKPALKYNFVNSAAIAKKLDEKNKTGMTQDEYEDHFVLAFNAIITDFNSELGTKIKTFDSYEDIDTDQLNLATMQHHTFFRFTPTKSRDGTRHYIDFLVMQPTDKDLVTKNMRIPKTISLAADQSAVSLDNLQYKIFAKSVSTAKAGRMQGTVTDYKDPPTVYVNIDDINASASESRMNPNDMLRDVLLDEVGHYVVAQTLGIKVSRDWKLKEKYNLGPEWGNMMTDLRQFEEAMARKVLLENTNYEATVGFHVLTAVGQVQVPEYAVSYAASQEAISQFSTKPGVQQALKQQFEGQTPNYRNLASALHYGYPLFVPLRKPMIDELRAAHARLDKHINPIKKLILEAQQQ